MAGGRRKVIKGVMVPTVTQAAPSSKVTETRERE